MLPCSIQLQVNSEHVKLYNDKCTIKVLLAQNKPQNTLTNHQNYLYNAFAFIVVHKVTIYGYFGH